MNGLQINTRQKQPTTKTEYCFQFLLLPSPWKNRIILIFSGILLSLFLFFKDAREGILVFINRILDYRTQKTGRIHLNYATDSDGVLFCCILAFIVIFIIIFCIQLYIRHVNYLVFLRHMNGKAIITGSIIFLLITLAALYIGQIYPSVFLSNAKEKLTDTLHTWRYEDTRPAMPEGNLSNLGTFEKATDIRLKIQTDYPQKLYLRGMVGELYTGTSWEPLEDTFYLEAENTFYWLHKSGFYEQTSIAAASKANAVATGTSGSDSYRLRIDNLSACREYQYLPYAMSTQNTLEAAGIGTKSALATASSVEITCLKDTFPDWYRTKVSLTLHENLNEVNEYLKLEQSYRELVQEHYLQITAPASLVCKRLFEELPEPTTLGDLQQAIRTVLTDTLTYNEAIHTPNGSNDFFQYTFEQSKRGYSVHFATAATLLFRYFGVPARYVEGYFLSADEAGSYKAGDTIALTDAHAHAWTEYYLEGIGWVPFEATPGYIDDEMIDFGHLTETDETITKQQLAPQNLPVYTKQQAPDDIKKLTELTISPQLPTHLLWLILLLLLLLILLVFVTLTLRKILHRRKILLRFYENLAQMTNREAITTLFAYANQLMQTCSTETFSDYEKINDLNTEAFFSNHVMTDTQLETALQFTKTVLESCKKTWTKRQQFEYHYIRWFYSERNIFDR